MVETKYTPYGDEWKNEILKMKKEDIVNLFQKNMKHKTIIPSATLEETQIHCEGIINNFESGRNTKEETLSELGEFSARLMDIFWNTTKKKLLNFIDAN